MPKFKADLMISLLTTSLLKEYFDALFQHLRVFVFLGVHDVSCLVICVALSFSNVFKISELVKDHIKKE